MNLEKLFSVFRISGSGLSAQRKFIETTASNIANIESADPTTGQPYTPKRISFSETKIGNSFGSIFNSVSNRYNGSSKMGSGVEALGMVENKNPYKTVYEPDNPHADADGYVKKPNIDLIKEMTNMMIASRAYEANVTVMNAAKSMMKKALEI